MGEPLKRINVGLAVEWFDKTKISYIPHMRLLGMKGRPRKTSRSIAYRLKRPPRFLVIRCRIPIQIQIILSLRTEYDFSKMKGAVRGKYVERFREGSNLVLLDRMSRRHFLMQRQSMRRCVE